MYSCVAKPKNRPNEQERQYYVQGNVQALSYNDFCRGKAISITYSECVWLVKGKGKAVTLQAWSGPEGSRTLRFPDFIKTSQDGGKVVSFTHRPPLPPGNAVGTVRG